jgi:glutamate synthase (NADPH/NADH) large chain
MSLQSNYPRAQGLYDPANEHDACGVAMVATLNKIATHSIVAQGLTALRNLEHRGASGAEPDSGDGAGILICLPDDFYRSVVNFELPKEGFYATGIGFIQPDAEVKKSI